MTMSENLRLFLLALDAALVVSGLVLIAVWALKPASASWMFRKVKLTLAQTLLLLGFSIAVLLMQIVPYAGHWIDMRFSLGKVFCGESHQYCYRDNGQPR
ncbi:MAG TPA: hypothetical protein VFW53_07510 [Gallionella sp.]|nr:hypothetical protein [Gallionella sp.]